MPSGQAQGSVWYQALQGILQCENGQLSGRILTGMENGVWGGMKVGRGWHKGSTTWTRGGIWSRILQGGVESKGKTEGK